MTHQSQDSQNLNPLEIDALAAEWLIRQHETSNWTVDDQQRFDTWLAKSSAHLMAYWRLEAAWRRADRLDALRRRPSLGMLISDKPRIKPILTKFAAAALILSILTVGTVAYMQPREVATYATAVGGYKLLRLKDGSQIELNTDTILRIAGGKGENEFWLDRGEAYFQIKHDPSRQFLVIAGDHRIIDLGTKFVVRSSAGRLEVTLLEGRARLESMIKDSGSRAVVLTSGDVAVANGNSVKVSKRDQAAAADGLGWRRGLLIFDNTPLSEVAAQFNRYNQRKLIVVGNSARNLDVGGHFQANNVEIFARVAQGALGLHVESRGNEILISH